MVPLHSLIAFAGLAFVLVVVPGPSVLFTIGRAITVGRRAALLTVAGNAAGVYVQVVAVAVGLGAIVTTSSTVFMAIKLAGAGYLIWLGIQAIRHRHDMVATVSAAMPSQRRTMMTALRDGFVVGFANPKSIVFLAALLPQFVTTSAGAVPVQMMLLGLCIPVFGLIFDSIWAMAAVAARTWFGRSPRRLAAVGATGGVIMIGIGTSLAFTGNRAAA
ncbi:LysE family translocator [Nocardia cyriacigeorgica]|uniref:LysE family translocator n=1 Tax=Nocardia cyriacigeorgica TaxID=135487 RepID=UPI001893C85E|nr:LysE family translocator [Nocardia cyriacigeorgica]MBF6080067.1 LysE family translocator [Nocardia cyriacigeorgica]